MRLAATRIEEEIASGGLGFDPPIDPALQIGPSSVDLLLSDTFFLINTPVEAGIAKTGIESGSGTPIDLRTYSWGRFVEEFGTKTGPSPGTDYFDLPPNRLVIGMTKEAVRLPQHLGGRVEGKSSLARIGLFIHISAPTIHPGVDSKITLEFYNVGPVPIRVHANDPICQLVIEEVSGVGLYEGQFQRETR